MASAPPHARPRSRTPSRPSTPAKDRPFYLRSSSTIRSNSSVSSLNSLFNSATRSADDDAKSLICRAFVPHIAVHVSDDTNDLAREKGFGSFQEILRPYGEDLQGRLTVRDSQGFSNSYDDFGVRFIGLDDVAASGERWETGISRASMNGRSTTNGLGEPYVGGSIEDVEELVNLHLERNENGVDNDIPSSGDQSLYFRYLRRLLSALPSSPQETFSHPVACVIAISSRNPDPIQTLRDLYASGNQVPLPSYVNTEYLRYYILVHDEDRDDITKSMTLFDQMKKHFGLHCHLLRLRSGGRTVVTDDDAVAFPLCQWQSAAEEIATIRAKDADDMEDESPLCLPDSDATGLRTMVREMTQVSVVPFMERCIATWNDQVASRRKGISGRFLSMSKRYFGGTSSRNSTSSSSNYDPVTASYGPHTPEAQMRKLADYAFMLRDWKLAHSIYDLLRTDFNNDKAWKYHAAAQEMTVMSLVLSGSPLSYKVRQDIIEPLLDLSHYSYVSRCSAHYSGLRCLLVAVELLRTRSGGAADEAAKWAIRARDMSQLGPAGHALITERVGECYAIRDGLGSKGLGSRRRKTAMWKMLAANEWVAQNKPAQARRCLDFALPVYENSSFSAVEEFVESLKSRAGYTPLVEVDGGANRPDSEIDDYVESERLELGTKRKSVVVPPQADIELEKGDDNFVDS
ncbi:ER-golgi trafficking TRAPP I complex 85 kDa subunit-domain-containing protein [Geopyxis carbonaria]|nr:ER-golgi trafficking TRAPP I complex 85 kDa subunit-domain-containing protein [Geopyxis carbonaria]